MFCSRVDVLTTMPSATLQSKRTVWKWSTSVDTWDHRPELAFSLHLHTNVFLHRVRHTLPLRRPATKSQHTLTNHHRPLLLSTNSTRVTSLELDFNTAFCYIINTRHRASTSMYSLTLCVRVITPPQYGGNGTASSSSTHQARRFYRWWGESSPACLVRPACGGPGGRPVGSATHF